MQLETCVARVLWRGAHSRSAAVAAVTGRVRPPGALRHVVVGWLWKERGKEIKLKLINKIPSLHRVDTYIHIDQQHKSYYIIRAVAAVFLVAASSAFATHVYWGGTALHIHTAVSRRLTLISELTSAGSSPCARLCSLADGGLPRRQLRDLPRR